MSLRSTPPWWKASRDRDSATDAKRGKIESSRMMMTVGQMKSHRAAPSERHASSVSAARRVARAVRADPGGAGLTGCSSIELPLDAEAGDIRSQLGILAGLLADGVPAIRDRLLGS